jgi:hypothetical protein
MPVEKRTYAGQGARKCRIVAFSRAVFERVDLEPKGSVPLKAWRCRFCGQLFVGSAQDRSGFAHDCEIPGDPEVEVRDLAAEVPEP